MKRHIPNVLSGIALLFSWLGIVFILQNVFYASLACMLLSFVFDALDGYVARSFGVYTALGRAIDGYVDVFNYLVYPAIALVTLFKLTDIISLFAIFIFLAAGVYRLARFQIRGLQTSGSNLYYEGLPVFISPFLILVFFVLSLFLTNPFFSLTADIILLIVAYLMVLKFKFPKPKHIVPMMIVVIGASLYFFAIQLL